MCEALKLKYTFVYSSLKRGIFFLPCLFNGYFNSALKMMRKWYPQWSGNTNNGVFV